MSNPMMKKWAQALCGFSAEVKPGNSVLITGGVEAEPLLRAVYAEVVARGGYPVMVPLFTGIQAALLENGTDEQLHWISPIERFTREMADVIIVILADSNTRALNGVDPARQAVFQGARRELFKTYMQRDADGTLVWTLTQYPTDAFAQDAEMSTEDFADFVFKACMLDQGRSGRGLERAGGKEQQILVDWLTGKKEVHLTGPDTDLRIDVPAAHGSMPTAARISQMARSSPARSNRAPKDMSASTCRPSPMAAVEDIRLKFENGKVVDASASKNEEFLLKQLDIDEGARYLGEFAFGTHFGIQNFTGQILFDEKIGGTVHMAVGAGYPETGNTNQSAVHWDMICDLRQGGRVEVDGEPFLVDGNYLPWEK